MEAGMLRHRITIQAPIATESALGKGAKSSTWSDLATGVYAFVRPLRAGEVLRAQQPGMETAYVVRMRHRTDLKAEHRIVWDGKYLYVQSVVNVNGRNVELEVLCNEREELTRAG